MFVVPAGWNPGPPSEANPGSVAGAVLVLLARYHGGDRQGFRMILVNTGPGSEYHPVVAASPSGDMVQVRPH